ncbi:unnamed protein product [Parascedosporium putredinis]|nr:unnamed protein product [Parascedosporium putredinis]CAI7988458.1 unnamed protein product [Parascedosporium putredinis]
MATDSLLLQLETYHRVSLLMYACLLWLVYLPCRLWRRIKPLDFLPAGLRTILSLPPAASDAAPTKGTVPEIHWPHFDSTDYFRIFCHFLFLITLQVYIAASRERDLWLWGNSRFKSTYGIELLHGLPYPRWGPRVDPRLMASHGELWDRMTFIIGLIPEFLVASYLWLDRYLALLGGALWTVLRRTMGDGVLQQAFG